jgi:Spy/CpxP family protein refolding chaperone
MLKISLVTLAVIGVLAAVGIAWARHSGYCAGGDYLEHVTGRVSRKLELNDEQNQNLKGFAELLRGLREDWVERGNQLSGEIELLLSGPELDRKRVMDLLAARHEAMSEQKHAIVEAFANFSDRLQPDQRARLAELIGQRMQRRWGPAGWVH